MSYGQQLLSLLTLYKLLQANFWLTYCCITFWALLNTHRKIHVLTLAVTTLTPQLYQLCGGRQVVLMKFRSLSNASLSPLLRALIPTLMHTPIATPCPKRTKRAYIEHWFQTCSQVLCMWKTHNILMLNTKQTLWFDLRTILIYSINVIKSVHVNLNFSLCVSSIQFIYI